MPVWVQLKKPRQIEIRGEKRNYQPGDWVQIGRSMALKMIDEGAAWTPDALNTIEEPVGTAGIMVFGGQDNASGLAEIKGKFEVGYDAELELRWEKTLFWDVSASLRVGLIPVGFTLLDKWQVVVPMWDYTHLAIAEGDKGERELTRSVIRDLRVPLYDTRLVFVRRCDDTRAFVETWKRELESSKNGKLAFLRALYRVKPLVCALPVTWTGQDAPRGS